MLNLTKVQIRAGIQIVRKLNMTIQHIADKYSVCLATVQKWNYRNYVKVQKKKKKN